MDKHEIQWTEILKTAVTTIIYVVGIVVGFYKSFIYYIDNRVKTDTDFIDTRVSLKLRIENDKLEKEKEELELRVKDIEQKFYDYNKERIKEITDLLKGYK